MNAGELNPSQQQAVQTEGHTNVVAQPGSGKTRVLWAKALWLLRRPASFVLAVTFTRDAAEELQRRILADISKQDAKRIGVGTFHSLASAQLKRAGIRLNLATAGQHLSLIERSIALAGLDCSVDDARLLIEEAKSEPSFAPGPDERGRLYTAYQKLLHRNNLADFQDLIILALRGMRNGEVTPFPATHVLVDEFQDTDPIQYEWLKQHAQSGAYLTVVADDDQSIYSWRHAMGFDGLLRFERDYSPERITLAPNYRSRSEVLACASRLIAHNNARLPKRLHADRGMGGAVTYRRYMDRLHEAYAIAECAREAPGSWAVLTRTNRLLDPVEGALTDLQVRYVRVGEKGFWGRKATVHLLAVLESALNPGAPRGLDHVLHWAGVDEEDLRRISSEHYTGKASLPSQISKEGAKLLTGFRVRFEGWVRNLQCNRVSLTLHGIAHWIAEVAPSKRDLEDASCAAGVFQRMGGTLRQRLARARQAVEKPSQDGVRLITMHGAKGLEFPRVWIGAVEEGVVPSDQGLVEEERRLMYVAMTRATDYLFLSSIDGKTVSRFVVESGLGTQEAIANVASN